jgi:hypothetical protein
VKTPCIATALALLFPTIDRGDEEEARFKHERFAIPFTFKPRLSLSEALIATAGALLRILLGSLLFAIWGTYSLVAWTAIRDTFWRISVQPLLFLLFLLSFSLLMMAIAALVRTLFLKLR